MARRSPIDPKSLELAQAAFICDFLQVRALLAEGAHPDARDADERTPIFSAVLGGSVGVLGVLLEAGADVDAHDREGWTALHHAAQDHLIEMARILLGRGANPNIRDGDGATPLWRAVRASNGRLDMVNVLREAGAKDDIPNNSGETARELDERLGLGLFTAN